MFGMGLSQRNDITDADAYKQEMIARLEAREVRWREMRRLDPFYHEVKAEAASAKCSMPDAERRVRKHLLLRMLECDDLPFNERAVKGLRSILELI